jgi:hypothetical protein
MDVQELGSGDVGDDDTNNNKNENVNYQSDNDNRNRGNNDYYNRSGQNGRIALHVFEYLLPHDAYFSAVCMLRLVVKKPYTAFRKFFLDMDTSLSFRSRT